MFNFFNTALLGGLVPICMLTAKETKIEANKKSIAFQVHPTVH